MMFQRGQSDFYWMITLEVFRSIVCLVLLHKKIVYIGTLWSCVTTCESLLLYVFGHFYCLCCLFRFLWLVFPGSLGGGFVSFRKEK
jgi:hypothetical protein